MKDRKEIDERKETDYRPSDAFFREPEKYSVPSIPKRKNNNFHIDEDIFLTLIEGDYRGF